MSVTSLTWSFSLPFRDIAAKAALNALADHADEDGHCWPSIARIALFSGCSDNTARRAIQRLEKMGAIFRQVRPGKSDSYRLNFDWHPSQPDTPAKLAPLPTRTRTPPNEATTPLNGDVDPSQVGTRTIIEPPIENHQGNRHGISNRDGQSALELERRATEVPSLASNRNSGGDAAARCACDSARDAWNETAGRNGWPTVSKFTAPRLKALQARLAELGGVDGWGVMLGKAEASDFVRTKMSAFSFDWILKPANLTKLMEGNYDNRDREPGTGLLAVLAALGPTRA